MAASMGSRSARTEAPSRRRPAATGDGDRVLVGEVLRPHGLRGEVKVEVHTDIVERFDGGSEMWWVSPNGRQQDRMRVRSSRPAKGCLLVSFDGVSYRDQAEALRGGRLEVDPEDVPEAPDGFYYYFQLVGCRCVDAELGELGQVVDIVEDGGGVLLEVAHWDEKLLLPFVDAFLAEVDIPGQRIDWKLPPGLVETCVSKS